MGRRMISAWALIDAGAEASSRGNAVPTTTAANAASMARQRKLSGQPPCSASATPAGTATTIAITTPR